MCRRIEIDSEIKFHFKKTSESKLFFCRTKLKFSHGSTAPHLQLHLHREDLQKNLSFEPLHELQVHGPDSFGPHFYFLLFLACTEPSPIGIDTEPGPDSLRTISCVRKHYAELQQLLENVLRHSRESLSCGAHSRGLRNTEQQQLGESPKASPSSPRVHAPKVPVLRGVLCCFARTACLELSRKPFSKLSFQGSSSSRLFSDSRRCSCCYLVLFPRRAAIVQGNPRVCSSSTKEYSSCSVW